MSLSTMMPAFAHGASTRGEVARRVPFGPPPTGLPEREATRTVTSAITHPRTVLNLVHSARSR